MSRSRILPYVDTNLMVDIKKKHQKETNNGLPCEECWYFPQCYPELNRIREVQNAVK